MRPAAGELHVGADVRNRRGESQDVDGGRIGLGVVGDDPHLGGAGHAGHSGGADNAAVVIQIGLDDVHHPVLDHPLKAPQAGVLLAAGHRDGEGVGHPLGFAELLPGARFLEETALEILEHAADLDGDFGVVRAVGVGVDDHVVAEPLAGQRHHAPGAARVGIGIAAHAAADLELDGFGVGERGRLDVDFDLLLGGRLAARAREVDGNLLADHAAQQLADRLAGNLAQ